MVIYAYVLPIEVLGSSAEKCGCDDGVCSLILCCYFIEAAEIFLRRTVGRVQSYKFYIWEGGIVTSKVISR
jgi:hypothetical protein